MEYQPAGRGSSGREMPGGAFLLNSGGMAADHGGGLTVPVVVTCLMAASGGLIFGYDIGISGAPPPHPRPPLILYSLTARVAAQDI